MAIVTYVYPTTCSRISHNVHVVQLPTLWWCTGGSVPHNRGWPIPLITGRGAESGRKAIGSLTVSTTCPLVPRRDWRNSSRSGRTGRFDTAGICIIAVSRRVVDGTGTTWWASGRKVTRFNDLIETIIIHGMEVDWLSVQLVHFRYLGQERERMMIDRPCHTNCTCWNAWP